MKDLQKGENKIYFESDGKKLEGLLYIPQDYTIGQKRAAMVVTRPASGVKEQTAVLYAQKFVDSSLVSSIEEEVFAKKVTVYPNPSMSVFNLSIAESRNASLVVRDLTGRIVHEKQNISSKHYQFEISGAAGIYFATLFYRKGKQTIKLVKQR